MTVQIPYEGQGPNSFPSVVRVARIKIGASSDNDVVLSSTGVYTLLNAKAGVVVHEIGEQINTAFTASVALDFGDSDDADGFFADTDNSPQSTDAAIVSTTGVTRAYAGGKLYAADQAVQITVSGAAVAAGQADVYVTFSQAGDE